MKYILTETGSKKPPKVFATLGRALQSISALGCLGRIKNGHSGRHVWWFKSTDGTLYRILQKRDVEAIVKDVEHTWACAAARRHPSINQSQQELNL